MPSFSPPAVLPSYGTVALISGDINGDNHPDRIAAIALPIPLPPAIMTALAA